MTDTDFQAAYAAHKDVLFRFAWRMTGSPAAPAIDIANRERAAIVAEGIALLPPLQRDVLILAEYEELTLDEICRAVDAELPAVKSRLHRARENLKRMLRPLLETKGLPHGR